MFLQRKWILSLLSSLFIIVIACTSIISCTQNTSTVQSVPLSGTRSTQAPKFSQTNILLAFIKDVSRKEEGMIEARVQAHEVRPLGIDNAYLVTVPGNLLNAIRTLRQQPGVKYAEPDYTQTVAAVPNDPGFPTQWGYQNTGQVVNGTAGTQGADEQVTPAWNVTTGSNSIVVAETDTGVDYTHPDLVANIWNNPGGIGGCPAGTHGYNTLTASCSPMDDDAVYGGHGTHVAGIMGAAGNNGVGVTGVNWHTTILPVKWVTANGLGATSDLITSLNWILQAKQAGVNIRVVNDSTVFVGTAFSQALSDEIDLLGQNGILFVTAAGNTGDNNDNLSVRRYPCGYDRPTEICVAASDQNDNLPGWANYGPHTVDLAAPGNNVYSTLPHNTYGFINGSSMASPQVAGAAALILSVQDMTPVQLKADILNNVDQIPSLKGLLITGGRLNICKALPTCVLPTPTPTPTAIPNAGTFGLTTIGANTDSMVSDRKRATKATLAVSGKAYKLTMYLTPTGVSGQEVMKGILYANQGGSPGTLLGVTNAFTFASTNTAGWYDMQFPSPVALTPGTYWIGVLSGNASHVAGFRWNSVSQIRALNSNTYASGPSSSFGTATIDAEQMSIYASYTTQGLKGTPTPTSTATPTPTGTPMPTATPTSTATPTPTITPTITPTVTPNPTPNIVGLWPMNESSGNFVADTTGNGYNGTAITTGIVAGKFGNARSFNGNQGYIQIANESTLPFGTSARTVCAWVLTNSLSGTSIILGSGTTSTDQFFALGRSGSSLAGFGWNDDLSVPNFFTTGTWNDVCLTYDGTTVALYGNGTLLTKTTKQWNTVDSGGTFIGNDYFNHVWSGNIDELSYYARALSATEIANLYAH